MKNVYFMCSHVSELVLYQEVSLFFNKFFHGVEQHLILIEYPPFAHIPHDDLLNHYDSVNELPQCECAFSNRWYYEFLPWIVFKRVARIVKFYKEIKNFTFKDDSILIINEMTNADLPIRFLLKKFRVEVANPIVYRVGTCYHRSDNCDTNNRISWLLHNIYVIIGAYPVSVHLYGWMVEERRYYQEKEIIDHFLVFSNEFKKHDEYTEIKYPLIQNKQDESQQKRYVFFFDNGLAWVSLLPEISKEHWINTMNQILQAITDLYKNEDVILLIKSHPGSKGIIPYNLAGFKIYEENITSEMIYHSCKEKIRAVYTVTSTGGRTASLYGIDSYVFYEMFDFPTEIMNRHKRYLLDFSNVTSIRNLDALRMPIFSKYSPTNNSDLEQVAQLFREVNKE